MTFELPSVNDQLYDLGTDMENTLDRVSRLEREVEKLKKPLFIVNASGVQIKPANEVKDRTFSIPTLSYTTGPVIKAGDRVKVAGDVTNKWRVVYSTDAFLSSGKDITDIYTKEEFEKNSALVQVHIDDYNQVGTHTGLDRVLERWLPNTDYAELTEEAVTALGEFKPVELPDYDSYVQIAGDIPLGDFFNYKISRHPGSVGVSGLFVSNNPEPEYLAGFKPIDRPIKVGDCVRWGEHAVYTVTDVSGGYAEGYVRSNGDTDGIAVTALTHVAKEDSKYNDHLDIVLGQDDIEPKTVDRAKVQELVQQITDRAMKYDQSNEDNPSRHEVNAAQISGEADGLFLAAAWLKNLLDDTK